MQMFRRPRTKHISCELEWLGDSCLTPNEQAFNYIRVGTRPVTLWWDGDDADVRFVLDKHAEMDMDSASFTESTVRGKTCDSTRIHYPHSDPTTLCSYSLVLNA